MRKVWFGALFALSIVSLFSLNYFNTIQRAAEQDSNEKLAGIALINDRFGLSRTKTSVLQTNDGGKLWRQMTLPKSGEQIVSAVSFSNEQFGAVILSEPKKSTLELATTIDGGANWTKQHLNLPPEIIAEANLSEIPLEFSDERNGWLILRLSSSSNFTRAAVFSTANSGNDWRLERNVTQPGEISRRELFSFDRLKKRSSTIEINGKEFEFSSRADERISLRAPLDADESVAAVDFTNSKIGWILTDAGRCREFKSDCEQQARLLSTENGGETWRDITPEVARKAVKLADSNNFAAPVGATRVSMNRGFDKCTAAPATQMQTWWNNSPFYDSNIYISGRNRGCSQPQLSAAWVDQVSAMGWGLIPTIVGFQAPCSVCTNCQKHSTDPATAETQGRGEADIAANDANNLGLTPGAVLYYDMERYDETAATPGCRTSVNAFLKGWTDRVKERGYVSGVYGSPTNAANDWVNIPAASRMDAIWMARWDNVQSVWFYASPSPQIPANLWANHQRIKQYQAPHDETWGGVTFNIDGNIADGPVAGARRAKVKPADFDGDGKTDVSVFRPEAGNWFVQNSSNNAFAALNFGVGTDIIAPGDYNGDGKTDFAVFRPSQGTWYSYSYDASRPNAAVYRARQFGANGDTPVAADFDGDGITDLAVFRQGFWYITPSFDFRDPNFRAEQFGTTGDVPVPGDYDGDGRADLAVFRPSTGIWYVQRSTAGFFAVNFGTGTDRPIQGDYDGDGKTDVAVYRPSNGVWYWLTAGGEFSAFNWGTGNDVPAPGDFDGDGKWDFAVFRPENGFWYAMRSQAGFMAVNFGTTGDRPIPAGYVPQN